MGPINYLATSVTNYQSTVRNIPEERRYHNVGEAWSHTRHI